MSNEPTISRREAAGAAVLGALALAVPNMAEAKPAPHSLDAIKALFATHNAAFSAQNLPGVLATVSPQAIFMGTAPGELWAGHKEISDAYTHFFSDFDKGQQKFENLWLDGAINGNDAWLMAISKVTMTKAGKKTEFGMNTSVTCSRASGKWLIHTMHFSNLAHAAANG